MDIEPQFEACLLKHLGGYLMFLSAVAIAARRGDYVIFQDVSFSLEGGDALILTGSNGSGKSTLLRTIGGFLRPERGTVDFTNSSDGESTPVREVSHYLGHRNAMKAELSVFENLQFWRSFLTSGSPATIEDATEAVGLSAISHLPFGYLSAGQQRRVAFAKLLVAPRPVWLLDEPTAALDSQAEGLIGELISKHQDAGGIVVAATHQPLDLIRARVLRMRGIQSIDVE